VVANNTMINFDDFIKKYAGVGIDVDNYPAGNLFQCMDLMHRFCQETLGLEDLRILAAPNAKTVYLNFSNVFGHELFEKIDNTPTGVPLKGDIVFYNWGADGHVDVFIQGDVNSFRSFSQNFPTGSKSIVVNHPNYVGVLGWLRLKPTTDWKKKFDELTIEYQTWRQVKQKEIDELKAKIQKAKNDLA